MVNKFLEEVTTILLKREEIKQEDFLCTLVYGSWNYELNTPESDMDLIIITKTQKNKAIEEALGEVCFLSIDQFLFHLSKRAPKYWEALLTKYCYINPIYKSAWLQLKKQLIEEVDHKDFLYTLKNKIQEHLDYLLWIPMQTRAREYYHQKRMYLLLRVREQYENIKRGSSFQNSLVHRNIFYSNLIEIKTVPNYLPPEQVSNIIKEFKHFLAVENPPSSYIDIRNKPRRLKPTGSFLFIFHILFISTIGRCQVGSESLQLCVTNTTSRQNFHCRNFDTLHALGAGIRLDFIGKAA